MLRRFPNRGCVARFSWVCHPHAYLARKLTGKAGGRLVPRIRTALRLPNWDVVWTKMRWAWRSSLTLFSIHTRRSFLRQLRLPQRDNMSSTDCHSQVRTSCFLWNLSPAAVCIRSCFSRGSANLCHTGLCEWRYVKLWQFK